MIFRSLLTLILSVLTLPLWAASYTLRPGVLPSVLREIEQSKAEKVVFAGEIYSSELEGLKKLPRTVTDLNLTQLSIKGENADSPDAWVLPSFALFATNIRVLRLPDSLTAIGEGAFAETPLESLHIPSGVTSIGPRAFYNCKSLKSVNMSGTKVTELTDECFKGCVSLEELWLPQPLASIGERALMGSAVKSLVIPSVNRIGRFAFAEMPKLSAITLRSGVEMGEGVLFNTPNLQGVADVALKSPAIGFAMSGSLADGNVIDDAIIGEGAFAGTNVSAIIIGKSVEMIRPHAFRNVGGLKMVDVTAKGEEIPELNEEAFSGVDVSKVRLRVIDGSEETWRNAQGWKEFIIEGSSAVDDMLSDANAISIEGSKGMVTVTSELPLEYVGIYSLSGMVLFERNNISEAITAGPFADKEVIVRAVTPATQKVATLLLH